MKTNLGILIAIIILLIFIGTLGGTYYFHSHIDFSRIDALSE